MDHALNPVESDVSMETDEKSDVEEPDVSEIFIIKEEPEKGYSDAESNDTGSEYYDALGFDKKSGGPESSRSQNAIFQLEKYSCDHIDCNYKTTNVNRIYEHFFQDHDEKRFKCQEGKCTATFASPAWMKRHIRLQHKSKTKYNPPFLCIEEECGKSFWLQTFLTDHVRRVHYNMTDSDPEPEPEVLLYSHKKGYGPKGVQMKVGRRTDCQFGDCSFKTTQAGTIFIHYSKVHKWKAFPCEEEGCGKRLCLPEELKRHVVRAHKAKRTRKQFACSYKECEKKFTTQHYLNTHERQVHEKRYRRTCETCGKTFLNSCGLKEHMKFHLFEDTKPFLILKSEVGLSDEKDEVTESETKKKRRKLIVQDPAKEGELLPFRCEVKGCTKAFRYECRLKTHIEESHTPKNFKCAEKGCKKRFATQRKLDSHVDYVHLRKDDRKCEKCGKVMNWFNLQYHMKLHKEGRIPGDVIGTSEEGEKIFICGIRGCGFTSVGIVGVVEHRISIHNQTPFLCEVPGCDRIFAQEKMLRRHEDAIHAVSGSKLG